MATAVKYLMDFDFHGTDRKYTDAGVEITEPDGTVWMPVDVSKVTIPGTRGTARPEEITLTLIEPPGVTFWHDLVFPKHINIDLVLWSTDDDGATKTWEFTGYSVGATEDLMRVPLTFRNILGSRKRGSSEHLALPEFDDAGDDFKRYAERARSTSWAGTPIGS